MERCQDFKSDSRHAKSRGEHAFFRINGKKERRQHGEHVKFLGWLVEHTITQVSGQMSKFQI